MTGAWWVVVSYRTGESDVLMARSWPAARRVRDEARTLYDLGTAVQIGVFDDRGECVYDAQRDWVSGSMTWDMTEPQRQGRYTWSESVGFVITGDQPLSLLAELVRGLEESPPEWVIPSRGSQVLRTPGRP